MKKKLIALGTVMAFGTLLGVGLAKHGADDGPGHVRGGNDDPPGHTRAAPKANSGFSVLERRGADDPQPHGRHGADDPAGHVRGGNDDPAGHR